MGASAPVAVAVDPPGAGEEEGAGESFPAGATGALLAAAAAARFSRFSFLRFSPTLRSFFFLGSSHCHAGMNESIWGQL